MKKQNEHAEVVELSSWKKYRRWQERQRPAVRFLTPFGVAPIRGLAEAPLDGLHRIKELWRLAKRRPTRANAPYIETFAEARERLGIDDEAIRREILMTRLGYAVAYVFFMVGVFLFSSTLIDIFSGAAQERAAHLVVSDLFWRGVWVICFSGPLFRLSYLRWQMEQQIISFRGFMREPDLVRRIWFGF